MTTASTKLITGEELLAMGDIGRCELIYGELVMMSPAGVEHGVVAMRIGRLLAEFVDAHQLGVVTAAETGFIVDTNPDLIRAPDAGFIAKHRLAGGVPKGHFEGVPDLAVEVVSPGESKREVAEKINMWLARGTVACWVAEPASKTVTIHRHGVESVRKSDEVRDEELLPGFVLPLGEVFKY
jgi:Uma2 family endonuclease